MAIYYFDIFDASGIVRDDEGQALNDLAEVRAEASEAARELLEQTLARRAPVGNRELRVRNVHGFVIVTMLLRDLLDNS